MTLVRKNFPKAAGAEFSNTGDVWCNAVVNACASPPNPRHQSLPPPGWLMIIPPHNNQDNVFIVNIFLSI